MPDQFHQKSNGSRRRRDWIIIGAAIVVVVVVAVIVFVGKSSGSLSASQASAELNHQMEAAMSSTGGSWKDYTNSSPWSPSTANNVAVTGCVSDPNRKQYEELANGPGFAHPDAIAAKVAKRWKAEGYVTEVVSGNGAQATEKSGFQIVFSASSTTSSHLLARSSCF